MAKNKKEYKKEYKRVHFGVQRVQRVHRVQSKTCTRKKKKMYSFSSKRVQYGNPDHILHKNFHICYVNNIITYFGVKVIYLIKICDVRF